MTLIKERTVDRIEVVGPYKHVQVRYITRIIEDGVIIATAFDRGYGSLSPDADVTNEDVEVRKVCNAVWVKAVKDAWTEFKVSKQL